MASYGGDIDPAALRATVAEAAPLISDTDLTVTALSLRLAEKILQRQPAAGPDVAKQVLGLLLIYHIATAAGHESAAGLETNSAYPAGHVCAARGIERCVLPLVRRCCRQAWRW